MCGSSGDPVPQRLFDAADRKGHFEEEATTHVIASLEVQSEASIRGRPRVKYTHVTAVNWGLLS